MGLPDAEPRWSLPLRIAFRFVFVYARFTCPRCFSIPSARWTGIGSLHAPLGRIRLRVGHLVFGVDITIRPTGSGDTTWNYVQVFAFAVLATFIQRYSGPIADHRRPNYRRLNAWLRTSRSAWPWP